MDILNRVHYVAGLLDGEGYFGYAQTPQIQVTSTDYDILDRCRLMMNIDQVIRHQSMILGCKQRYNLNICGNVAIQWMMTIYPLLCKRRQERIREVIQRWKDVKVSKLDTGFCINGHRMTPKNTIWEYPMSGAVKRCRICRKSYKKLKGLE